MTFATDAEQFQKVKALPGADMYRFFAAVQNLVWRLPVSAHL